MQTKFFKKAIVLFLSLTLVMSSVIACGKKDSKKSEPAVDITAEELITKVYENTDAELYNQSVSTMPIDIEDTDSMLYYLGVESLDGLQSAAVSEPMMSSIAHSVVALKFDSADAANAAASSLKDTAPVQKWLCVMPDAVTTKVVFNTYVVFCMSSTDFVNNLDNMTIEVE